MAKDGNTYKFNYFKDYASFLFNNHLQEVLDQYVKFAEELDPGWRTAFGNSESLRSFFEKGVVGFLQSVIKDSEFEFRAEAFKVWEENTATGIQQPHISSRDLIKSISIRRLANIHFIHLYTQDVQLVQHIYRELENFYNTITQYALDIFLEGLKVEARQTSAELRISQVELQSINEDLRENQEELQSLNEELREQVEQRILTMELREKERKYLEIILENISDGIVACDENGVLTFFNHATREFHGINEMPLPAEQWSNYYNLYHTDGVTPMKMEEVPLFRAFKGEKVVNQEIVIAAKNHKKRWVLCNGNAIISEGKKVGAVVVMTDITIRRESEKQLEEYYEKITLSNRDLREKQEELANINEELRENQEELQTLNEELREQIEQRLEIEDALRLNEKKYRELSENLEEAQEIAHVGSWELDISTNEVFWSAELYRIFGYKPYEIKMDFKRYLEHLLPGFSEEIKHSIEKSITESQPYEVKHKIVAKDGSEKWILGKGKVEKDKTGKPKKLKGIAIDITESTKFEIEITNKNKELAELLRELKEAEERLVILNNDLERRVKARTKELELVNHSGKLISSELELSSIVQKVVDVTTELIGAEFGAFFYSVVDQAGESMMLFSISGVKREAFSHFPMPRKTKIFGPTMEGSKIVRSDDITKDVRYGKSSPFFGMPEGHMPVKSYLAVPVVSRNGVVLGALFYGHSEAGIFKEQAEHLVEGIASQAAIAIDNSRLYENLQGNEQRLKIMLESIPAMAWTANQNGEIDYFNERYYTYSGFDYESSIGWGWTKTIHPEDLVSFKSLWISSITSGEDFVVETRMRSRDGSYKWQLCRAVAVRDNSNKIIKWFGTCTDIDEQKQTTNQLVEINKELLKVNEFLDTFVYIAAHDLRSPLSNLRMILDLLNKSQVENKRQELLNALNISVNKLDQTVNGLVKIIEIQSTDTSVVTVLKLEDILTTVKDELSHKFEEQEVELKVDLSRASEIKFIEAYLISIVKNIVGNALKYYSPKRPLKVAVQSEWKDGFLVLAISDNGVGMDLNKYGKNIFKPFTRFSKIADGKGLGLYLVKNMVEKNGGRIEVESELDVGTTFRIFLKSY
jgi:PAS domain S-box-containing protein